MEWINNWISQNPDYSGGMMGGGILAPWIQEEAAMKTVEADMDVEDTFFKAGPEYPDNVYGPDINGWFWEEMDPDFSGVKYWIKWPSEPDAAGYDPYQPNFKYHGDSVPGGTAPYDESSEE